MKLTVVFFGLVLVAISFVDCIPADNYAKARHEVAAKSPLKKYEEKNVKSKTPYVHPTVKALHPAVKPVNHAVKPNYAAAKPVYAEKKKANYKPTDVAVKKDTKESRYHTYKNHVSKAVEHKKHKYEVKRPKILEIYKKEGYKHNYPVSPKKEKKIKNKSKEYKKGYEVSAKKDKKYKHNNKEHNKHGYEVKTKKEKKYKHNNKEHKHGYEVKPNKEKKHKYNNKEHKHGYEEHSKKEKKRKNKEYKAYEKKEKKAKKIKNKENKHHVFQKYLKDAGNNRAHAGKQHGFYKKAL